VSHGDSHELATRIFDNYVRRQHLLLQFDVQQFAKYTALERANYPGGGFFGTII
jgi:hypothetical protein